MGKGPLGKRFKLAKGFRTWRHVERPGPNGAIVYGRQKAQVQLAFHKEGLNPPSSSKLSEHEAECDHFEDSMDIDDIMSGRDQLPISNAGGELFDIISEELRANGQPRRDTRDRRDRIIRRNEGFKGQISQMTDSYLRWRQNNSYKDQEASKMYYKSDGEDFPDDIQGTYDILVVDMYWLEVKSIPLRKGDHSIVTSLISQGLIPCAPYHPTVAITVRALESFRIFSLRCPRFAIQMYIKSVADIHQRPYKSYLTKQTSICFDVYLAILEETDTRLRKALARNTPWGRLKRACPACTYVLEGEPDMRFNILFTMDGNNALKRMPKRESLGETNIGMINELPDDRTGGYDYYIDPKEVNKWLPHKKNSTAATNNGEEDEDSPCSEKWKNMSEKATAKAFGMFEETGVFVAVCRHGFVLVYTDMIRSGEGTQYPLAVVNTLMDTFGEKLGGGYDIGCRFKTSLAKSELGNRAHELKYTSLVGAFHGHAHNRRCQLSFLATYVEGLGLSDLEGCERLFSRSNELASTTRHCSTFHRRQRITSYFKHLDETDTYESLSKYLVTNLKRALSLLADRPAFEKTKQSFGIEDDSIFKQWLKEEHEYLETRGVESLQETWEMEYLRHLKDLKNAQEKLASTKKWFIETPTELSNVNTPSTTAKLERERRHAIELETSSMNRVQELEVKLGITKRWEEDSEKWNQVSEMIATRDYRLKLGRLEQLIVARIFELGRMNGSQKGYKLRQQVAKALQGRSKAVKTALKEYNDAAKCLVPPRPRLEWDQVVEYTFLSEFELLADCSDDVRQKPWAQPASRLLIDQFFKMERAKEEVVRVRVEAARLLAYMCDEEAFLSEMEEHLLITNPPLGHQLGLQNHKFKLVNQQHIMVLEAAGLFSLPGRAVSHVAGELESTLKGQPPVLLNKSPPLAFDDQHAQEELEDEEAEEELSHDLESLLTVSDLVLEEPDVSLELP